MNLIEAKDIRKQFREVTEENLRIFAALYNVRMDKKQIQTKLEECNLHESRKTLASRLSGGQQKNLRLPLPLCIIQT